jgi:hypothetical protein
MKITMRPFQFIFTILWGLSSLGNILLFLYIESEFLEQSFTQILNPFLHLQVFEVMLTTPLFWVLLAATAVSQYAASSIERYLKQGTRRAERNIEKVHPAPQISQEKQPSSSLSSDQSKHEQPRLLVFPRPLPEPASELDVQVTQRPYLKCRTSEIEEIAASEWNNIKILNQIHY